MTTAGFAFVADPLDRSDALRDDDCALSTMWPQARVVLVDAEGRGLADVEGRLWSPRGSELGGGPGAATFLGCRGTQPWFALPAELAAQDAPSRIDLRTAAAQWPEFEATVFAQARAILHWRTRQRFCGVCGRTVAFQRGGWRAVCTGCGAEHYPRTDPAVIVAVGAGDSLLLGRQAGWPARRYSTLAGFVEPGESIEQAVAREVLEESGVRVRSMRYLASQPWPFPGALMLGCLAEAEPDTPRVGDELEDARWFSRAQIGRALAGDDVDGPALSPPISISRWLIATWHARSASGMAAALG